MGRTPPRSFGRAGVPQEDAAQGPDDAGRASTSILGQAQMDVVLVPRWDEPALHYCGQQLAEIVAGAVADGMRAGLAEVDAEEAQDRAEGAPDPDDAGSPGAERQTRGGAPA